MSRSTVEASGSDVAGATGAGVGPVVGPVVGLWAGLTVGLGDAGALGVVVGCGTLTACRRGEKLSKRLVTCRYGGSARRTQ